MLRRLGIALAAGVLLAGCGPGPAPAGTTLSTSGYPTSSAPSSATSVPASSVVSTRPAGPATSVAAAPETTVKTTAPKIGAPRTTAPKVAAAKPKPPDVAAPAQPAACSADYYRNSSGICVHRPSSSSSGATALCKDGSYSYSQHRSGTCSGHGGVRTWL